MPRKSGRAQLKLTVYIDADTSDALRAFCERDGRQQSRVVDSALRAYLDARPL